MKKVYVIFYDHLYDYDSSDSEVINIFTNELKAKFTCKFYIDAYKKASEEKKVIWDEWEHRSKDVSPGERLIVFKSYNERLNQMERDFYDLTKISTCVSSFDENGRFFVSDYDLDEGESLEIS